MRVDLAGLVQFISRQGQRLARAAKILWHGAVRRCVGYLQVLRRLAHPAPTAGRGREPGVWTFTDPRDVTWTAAGGTGPGKIDLVFVIDDSPSISVRGMGDWPDD